MSKGFFSKLNKSVTDEVKLTQCFKRLNLPYPDVSGYPCLGEIAYSTACVNLHTLESFNKIKTMRELQHIHDKTPDFLRVPGMYAIQDYFTKASDIPVRYLESTLLEAFKRSSIPDGLVTLDAPYPYGFILFPEPISVFDKQYPVNWVGYVFVDPGLPKQFSFNGWEFSYPASEEKRKFLAWFSICSNEDFTHFRHYGSNIYYDDEKELSLDPVLEYGEYLVQLKENMGDVIKEVGNIVIQTLLYLQTRPEDVTPVNPYSLAPGEPKQAKKGGKKRYTPLMIGKQFKPKTETVPLGGTHASPRTHWRRGHWRRVAIGEGRGDRKWHWFQPVLVNG